MFLALAGIYGLLTLSGLDTLIDGLESARTYKIVGGGIILSGGAVATVGNVLIYLSRRGQSGS